MKNVNEIDNKEEKLENKEAKKDIRDTLYSKIDITTKSMDKIIIGLTSLLIISIVCGML
ncbi:hypothetical protein [Clostridium sp.]|uniref:hypothetical protein n=1 Tax=Clostridium sp. TaxID=1506 RepID=UPI0026389F54|nr:hypothetical protein [Clostridium sp.]